MSTDEAQIKTWIREHVTSVRPEYRLAGTLVALISAAFSAWQGSANEAANTKRVDEAIQHVEDMTQRNNESIRRILDQLPIERAEIKADLRRELDIVRDKEHK